MPLHPRLPVGATLVVALSNQPPLPLMSFCAQPSSPHVIPSAHPTSPVGTVLEPPFPLQHHASPSPLPVGATLVVALSNQPTHLNHYSRAEPAPVGASLVAALPSHPFPTA